MTPNAERREFITPGFIGATVLVVALFAFWGMSNSLNDVLIPKFRRAFQLGDFASSFVQWPGSPVHFWHWLSTQPA